MKKLLFIFLILLSGCTGRNVDHEGIADVEDIIADLEAEIQELENENEELKYELEDITSKFEDAEKENAEKTEEINLLTADNEILNERISQIQSNFTKKQAEPTQVIANNPLGVFTTGSSQDHVRKIMGNPDNVMNNGISVYWWYGSQAWISFNKNGFVDSWYDYGDTLKHE